LHHLRIIVNGEDLPQEPRGCHVGGWTYKGVAWGYVDVKGTQY